MARRASPAYQRLILSVEIGRLRDIAGRTLVSEGEGVHQDVVEF